MKSPRAAWLRIAFAAVVVALLAPSTGLARDDDDVSTEDILHMVDGRELHGRILSESKTQIVFEIIDLKLHMKSRRTFRLDEIAHIERGVEVETAAKPKESIRTRESSDEPEQPRYGRARPSSDAQNLPGLYLVPMKGQMGTDIHPDVYREMVDDIRRLNPDYLVLELQCQDTEDRLYTRWGEEERGFDSSTFLDSYRELVNLFRDELRDIPQVMWVHDSQGISSVIAMAWDELYMKPAARLGGIADVRKNFNVSDEEVYAKFREAYMAWLKGFAEYGGYSLELIDAMVLPEFTLSASFKGREVVWALNDRGEFLVDDDDENTVDFRAKDAEDLAISDGTVETLDDLAFLLGYREYRVIEGEAEEIFDRYVKSWRRNSDNCKTWWADYQQHRGWASGDETLKWLGRAKIDVEKIIRAIDRYEAVKIRLQTELGLRRFDLVTIVEQLREQIRSLRQQQRGGRGGGGVGRGGTGVGR
ncbi:MAG: hypothetical protein O7D97_00950 [Planctomycetota bacterium]|nr:hypothetical protein [Planctomycetota bacterium]